LLRILDSVSTSIPVYLSIGFLSCSTSTLLENSQIFKLFMKPFLTLCNCVLRCLNFSLRLFIHRLGGKMTNLRPGFNQGQQYFWVMFHHSHAGSRWGGHWISQLDCFLLGGEERFFPLSFPFLFLRFFFILFLFATDIFIISQMDYYKGINLSFLVSALFVSCNHFNLLLAVSDSVHILDVTTKTVVYLT
jgi:hypothetical protein